MNNKFNYKKYIIIILIIGILLRFILAIIYHPSGDACWHLSIARYIGQSFEVPLFENLGRDSVFSRPPLFHILAAISYNIFGIFGKQAANFGLKMISPLFGSLTLILFYKLINKHYNIKITFLAVSVLTFFPLHLFYSAISYIESTLAFFGLLSIYFLTENKILLSAISAGFSSLLKYEGIFIVPVLIAILIYNHRKSLKNSSIPIILVSIISFIIYSPLLIRNWIKLGNPVWPYLTNILGGYPLADAGYASSSLMNLYNINTIIKSYLEFFGIPDGNYKLFFFFKIPLIELLIFGWLITTFILFCVLIYGFIKTRNYPKITNIMLIWIIIIIILVILTKIFHDAPFIRYLFIALPAICLIWALGINEILKIKKIKLLIIIFLITIIIVFTSFEFVKIYLAKNSWTQYQEDFDWIKSNTPKDSTVFYRGQCLAFNTEKSTTYPYYPSTGQYVIPSKSNELKNSYVWINQDFHLESQSILPQEIFKIINKKYELIYQNNMTKTKIYKIN